jgi:5-methylcytosine-specific restriction endonuclease McrA
MSTPSGDNCYGSAQIPASSEELAERFRELRKERNRPGERLARRRIAKLSRDAILQKTGGRCHICGGNIDKDSYWEADHVFPAKGGGPSNIDNYLPAHGQCNSAKWDQSVEELQWVLKIGVWAKHQMEGKSKLGRLMLDDFWASERRRVKRQKANRPLPKEPQFAVPQKPEAV